MVDFSPLQQTLKEKGVKISTLRSLMSSATVTKLNQNEMDDDFYFSTVEKICLHLDVPIEKVVRIIPDSEQSDKC